MNTFVLLWYSHFSSIIALLQEGPCVGLILCMKKIEKVTSAIRAVYSQGSGEILEEYYWPNNQSTNVKRIESLF